MRHSGNTCGPVQSRADDRPAADADMHALCAGTNINENTLLATDYLNHFNEIIMLLDMVPNLPAVFEDVMQWRPKSYRRHFAESGFSDKDLAISAYDHVAPTIRERFDAGVEALNDTVRTSVNVVQEALEFGDCDLITAVCTQQSHDLMSLMDRLSAVINGTGDGAQTDQEPAPEAIEHAQACVDALFEA